MSIRTRLEPFKGETSSLMDLCIEVTDCHHSTPTWTDSGKLVIRNFNIKGGFMDLSNPSYTDEETYIERIRRSVPEPGDLIITREAPMGEVCIIPEGIECCLGQRMVLIKPDHSKVSSEFLLFALQSEFVQKQIQKSDKTGSIVSNLRIPVLKELQIPRFGEQTTKIGEILWSLNSKISLNNRINQELEAMAKLIYDYWFVQFDFLGENGKPYKSSGGKMVYNEQLKREIPEGWGVKELDQIATIIMGQSPKGDTYNSDGIGTPLLNGPADYENGVLKGRTYTTAPTRLCSKDDLVFCIRATIGNLVYSEEEFCLGRGVAAVRPDENNFSELVYYFLLQEIERFKIHASGSIIKGITKDDLTKSKCVIPELVVIDSFHDIVKPIFDKVRINKLENQKLSELRDWLLPMLMNGQVTISTSDESSADKKKAKQYIIDHDLRMAAEEGVEYGK